MRSRSTQLTLAPFIALVLTAVIFASPSSTHAKTKNEPSTVPFVDLTRYVGLWYEIAAIPQSFQKQCVSKVTAEYTPVEDGLIKVVNSCREENGAVSQAEGRAKIVDPQTNAKLKVTFVKLVDWVFTFGGDYWVIDLAPDYSYAVVGHPTRDYGWILSRTPSMSMDTLREIETRLRAQGYDSCRLLTTLQDNGLHEKKPLCEIVKP